MKGTTVPEGRDGVGKSRLLEQLLACFEVVLDTHVVPARLAHLRQRHLPNAMQPIDSTSRRHEIGHASSNRACVFCVRVGMHSHPVRACTRATRSSAWGQVRVVCTVAGEEHPRVGRMNQEGV